MKSKPGQMVKLYEWNGETSETDDDPISNNPLAADTALNKPGLGLPYHTLSGAQTPDVQTTGSSSTPDNTPSKTSKTKGLPGKILNPKNGRNGGSGSKKGGSGSTTA